MKHAARIFIVCFFSTAFFLFPRFSIVHAASFSLYPSRAQSSTGYAFSLDLSMDTHNAEVSGADVAIDFDPSIIEILAVPNAEWFSQITHNAPPANDTLLIHGLMEPAGQTISGSGSIASITLRAIRPGYTSISIICNPGDKNDSNIWNKNVEDIIDCSKKEKNTVLLTITDDQGRTPKDIPDITFPPGKPACDLCGACKSKGGIQKPSYWHQCRACIYNKDNTVKKGFAWTPIGCVSAQPGPIIGTIFRLVFPLSGGIAFLILLFGGFKVMTSRGDYDQLAAGKRLMIGAVVSLLLIIFSFFIIRFVAVTILGIPGFG